MNAFFTSWFAVVVFFGIGLISSYSLIKLLNKGNSYSEVRNFGIAIFSLIYSISLTIAKLSGKY